MAYSKMVETYQIQCKAIEVEPPLTPKGSDGTQPTGRRPSARANAHKRWKPAAKTLRERGDNATGSTNETDAKKRRRARSGQSQRESARPTALAYGKMVETNQVQCKAIEVEPPLTPKGSDGTQPTGRRPSARANAHKRWKPAAKTLHERGDNATGSTNETDAKKRRRARSGQSQRASARPTA